MNPAPRPLLIAESCNPEWVSVPLEGYCHSRAIAAITGGHVVTQIRNREAMLRAGWTEGKDFTAIDSEGLARPLYRIANLMRGGKGKGWTMMTALSGVAYPWFEELVWRAFEKRLRQGEFDLVHRVTPLSPTIPSWIAGKCREIGVPFVIGPLNGGVPWPKGFDSARRREKEWLSYVREAHRMMPGYGTTRRNATVILAGSINAWEQISRGFLDKTFYVPENAIDPARFVKMRTRRAGGPVKGIFVGRLVPYKGADMLLEAGAELVRAGKLTLDVIGDGPQKPELEKIIEREGIANGVRLAGWVEHGKLQDWLADSDLFTFPSVREFGGAVVLEAMGVGVPAAVVDYGGPGELVTQRTGWRVPIGSRREIIEGFRAILSGVVDQPSEIDEKSDAAVQRVREHFSWEAKAKRVVEIYQWVCGTGAKPMYPMPTPDD